MDNLKQEKKMQEEDYNSQAAKDARMEMEREAKALAENEKELERTAKERYYELNVMMMSSYLSISLGRRGMKFGP